MDMRDLDGFLAAATVGAEVFALRPDYRVVLIAVDGIEPGSGDEVSEALLVAAEEHARRLTEGTGVEELPHIASWRAIGDEPFDTAAAGSEIVEFPDRGEVVWCDDAGVTCRRWNWRQGRRTRLREDSRAALFILDALDPMTDDALAAAADDLANHVRRLGPQIRIASRLIGSSDPAGA